MRIMIDFNAGTTLYSAGLQCLTKGCDHIYFNDKIYKVTVNIEEVSGMSNAIEWIQGIPKDVREVKR